MSNAVRNKIINYAKSQGLCIGESNDAIDISFLARPNFELKITVPNSVNEWYISLKERSGAKEIYSDWVDHYHIDKEDETDLDEEMQSSIINTIKILHDAEVRVGKSTGINFFRWVFFATDILEVLTESGWVDHNKLT